MTNYMSGCPYVSKRGIIMFIEALDGRYFNLDKIEYFGIYCCGPDSFDIYANAPEKSYKIFKDLKTTEEAIVRLDEYMEKLNSKMNS
jgi:hypothetical protein